MNYGQFQLKTERSVIVGGKYQRTVVLPAGEIVDNLSDEGTHLIVFSMKAETGFVVEYDEVEHHEQCPCAHCLESISEGERIERMIIAARYHLPDCMCPICVYGADAWVRNFHPAEY